MQSRRVLLVVLAAVCAGWTLEPACAKPRQAHAHAHARTEPLDIVTSTGKLARFQVEFVDTDPTRERGLMFRKSLAPDSGMLFDFKTSQEVSFWMKNTLIPLDMLFIDQSGKIVNIHRQATPLSETAIPSDGPIRGVLEIAGGRAQDLDILPGDHVRHRIFASR